MKYLGRTAVRMVGRGEGMVLLRELGTRIYANQRSLILRCDLVQPPPIVNARIPLTVRKLEKKDIRSIISARPRRLPLFLEDIPSCYVAVTDEEKLAYMNWVVLSGDWERFSPYFAGDLHKVLASDECLFEFAYTFEKYRGLGIMGTALAGIIHQLI